MKRVLKGTGIPLGGLVTLACIPIYGVSESRLRQTFDIAATPITVERDYTGFREAAGAIRGRRLVRPEGSGKVRGGRPPRPPHPVPRVCTQEKE